MKFSVGAFLLLAFCKVGGQAVLVRQNILPTPWLTERHGYDPTSPSNTNGGTIANAKAEKTTAGV